MIFIISGEDPVSGILQLHREIERYTEFSAEKCNANDISQTVGVHNPVIQ